MIDVLTTVLLTIAVVGTLIVIVAARRANSVPKGSGWVTSAELAQFEERLSGLTDVVIDVDRIDVPSEAEHSAFLKALLDNFGQQVKYHFLISPSFYDSHHEKIRKRYDRIAMVSADLRETEVDPRELVFVHRDIKPRDADYPYLFYRFRTEDERKVVVGFRGDEKGTGIASRYRKLDATIAESMFRRLVAMMPSIQTEGESFAQQDDGNVIRFDREFRRRRQEK